jgi:hypothetical protein
MLHEVHTLGALCLEGAKVYKGRKALEFCGEDRLLETVNFRTLALRSRQLAGLLQSLGVNPGDRVMILGENLPAWTAAVFGTALAGAISLPIPPHAPLPGKTGKIAALFVTQRTVEQAAALDPLLPRIYLDSPVMWTSIGVSIGSILKHIPLSRTGGRGTGMMPGDGAVQWPDGTLYSHGEIMSLVQQSLRLFPRDRVIPICSLAEKRAFILGVLATVLGGASVTCLATQDGLAGILPNAEILRTVELLRPTVVIGDGDFLDAVYRETAAPLATGLLSRCFFTRPLARLFAGRRFIKALGGNIRFYGISDGEDVRPETAAFLRRIHVPYLTTDPARARLRDRGLAMSPGGVLGSAWKG